MGGDQEIVTSIASGTRNHMGGDPEIATTNANWIWHCIGGDSGVETTRASGAWDPTGGDQEFEQAELVCVETIKNPHVQALFGYVICYATFHHGAHAGLCPGMLCDIRSNTVCYVMQRKCMNSAIRCDLLYYAARCSDMQCAVVQFIACCAVPCCALD